MLRQVLLATVCLMRPLPAPLRAPLLPQIGAGTEQVLISPLVIAGWCGLVTTALNALPAGSLDGGRMVQAAYGKQVREW